MENQSIAERISIALKKKNLTQKELASISGIKESQISAYINGAYEPTRNKISMLSKALDVSEVWLMGYDAPMRRGEPFYDPEKSLLTIPFISQKLSAGFWEEELPEDCVMTKTINILDVIAKGYDKKTLIAAEVVGDSMIDENICDGDIAIFSKGCIRGDGIYAIALNGVTAIKRIVFDYVMNSLKVYSANKNKGYEPMEVPNDENLYRILGKVVGLIHVM